MTDYTGDSLSALADECRVGNKDAWGELVKRITPFILSIGYRMNLNRDECFDILGQVLYILLDNLDKIRSSSKLLAFIRTTTRREVFQAGRKNSLYNRFEDSIVRELYGREVKRPDDILEKNELTEALMQAIMGLSGRDFNLIYALFFDINNPSYEDISTKLKIPIASIGPTRGRILDKLMKILVKDGYDITHC